MAANSATIKPGNHAGASFRHEILDANIFGSIDEVRDFAHEWMKCYNEERPHDSLCGIPPSGPIRWLFQGPPAESKLLAAITIMTRHSL